MSRTANLDEKRWTNQPEDDIEQSKKRSEHPDHLYVNEEFFSIQGEGLHTGIPMYFVRLQGCEVGCYFCDTKYTWRKDESKKQMIGDIINRAKKYPVKWICVTGGEPYEQDFYLLCQEAQVAGFMITVETSGTTFKNLPVHHITLSPKDLFSKKKTLDVFRYMANEVKCVVTKMDDVIYYSQNYLPYFKKGNYILQCVDNNSDLAQQVLDYYSTRTDCKQIRIMVQQHKVIKLQ